MVDTWNRFITEICYKNIAALNEIQKTAVLCFWYDAEVNSGGHCSYFSNFSHIDSNELLQSIITVSNQKIASNYKEALYSGREDHWQKVDYTYYQFSPSLCDYLQKYIENNIEQIFR